jgi:hypothetical protein
MVDFNVNCTVRVFLATVKEFISQNTGLEQNNIEIIKAGRQAQEDDSEILDSNQILNEIYTDMAFYFRPSIPEAPNNFTDPCCICLNETTRRLLTTRCCHLICSVCYNRSFEHNIRSCPMCRADGVIV